MRLRAGVVLLGWGLGVASVWGQPVPDLTGGAGTFALEIVEVGTTVASTVTASAVKSGNSFTVTVGGSNASGSGTGKFTMSLAATSYSRYGLTAFSPKFVVFPEPMRFNTSSTVAGTGTGGGFRYRVEDCDTVDTLSSGNGECSLADRAANQLPIVAKNGKWMIRVKTQLSYLGGVAVDAYYSFLREAPAPGTSGPTQDLRSYSGPFWEHRVSLSNVPNGCTMTVGGNVLRAGPATAIAARTAPIPFTFVCTAAASSFGQFSMDGEVEISGTQPGTPVLTHPQTGSMLVATPSMPTVATLRGNLNVTSSAAQVTGWEAETRVLHGHVPRPGDPANVDLCKNQTDKTTRTVGTAARVQFSAACENERLIQSISSTPHGFADRGDTVRITTQAVVFASARTATALTPVASFTLQIDSVYKIALPKLSVEPARLRVGAAPGAVLSEKGSIQITNIGGGLLDWTASGAGTAPIGGFVFDPPFGTPPAGNGVKQGESVTVLAAANAPSGFPGSGTLTGRVDVKSANASNNSPVLSIPVEVVIGAASVPDQISMSDIFPEPGRNLEADTVSRLSANVKYQLGSKDQASVRLELLDASFEPVGSIPIAASEPLQIARGGSGTVPFILNHTVLTGTKAVRLMAVMRDAGGAVILRSEVANYGVTGKLELTFVSSKPASPGPLLPRDVAIVNAGLRYSLGPLARGVITFEVTGDGDGATLPGVGPIRLGEGAANYKAATYNPSIAGTVTKLLTLLPGDETRRVSIVAVLRQDLDGPPVLRSAPLEFVLENPAIRLEEVIDRDTKGPLESVLNSGKTYTVQVRVSFDGAPVGSEIRLIGSGFTQKTVVGVLGAAENSGEKNGTFRMEVPNDSLDFSIAAELVLPSSQSVLSAEKVYSVMHVKLKSVSVNQPVGSPRKDAISRRHMPRFSLELEYNNPLDVPVTVECYTQSFGAYTGKIQIISFSPKVEIGPVPEQTRLKFSLFSLDGPDPNGGPSVRINVICAVTSPSERAVSDQVVFTDFFDPVTVTSGGKVESGPLTLDRIFSDASQSTTISQQGRELSGNSGNAPKSDGGRGAAIFRGAGIAPGDFLGIDTSWQFEPPLAATSRFSADLKLNYAAFAVPVVPGLGEADLKIVSLDPAGGVLEVLPTVVDVNNKVATGQMQRGVAYYSLGFVGPFKHQSLDTVVSGEPVYVNAGGTPLQVTVNGYGGATGSAAVQAAIPAGAQLTRGTSVELGDMVDRGNSWLRAAGDSPALRGVTLLRSGRGVDSLEQSAAPGTSLVLTGIEVTAFGGSEIQIANSGGAETTATVVLYSTAGAVAGSVDLRIAANGRWSGAAGAVFGVASPFTGYAVITATQRVSAATISAIYGTLAALPAQAYDGGAGAHLYSAPLLSGGQADTRFDVVNTGARAVSYLVRAYGENGLQAGQTVTGRLERGEQLWAMAGERLALAESGLESGSLVIETDGPVSGDVSLQSSSARAAVRLIEPQTSWVIPYVEGGGAALSIHNPGANPAAVRVRVMNGAGAAVGAATVSVAARRRSSQLLVQLVPAAVLLRGGWVSIDSDQPVTAFSLFGSLDADIGVVAGQPGNPAPSGPAAAPAISVTPGALDFGSVTAGQTKELPLTVRNTGTAALTVTAAAITSSRFAVISPTGTFTVAAGASQTMTVRFSPAVAGSESGSLILNSNDPAKASTTVPLTGSGAAVVAPANFGGQWNSDYGQITMTQNGANVTGVYPSYTGTLTGTVAGNVLTGTWSQPGTTGTFTFVLSADGNRFTGTWTRTTGGTGGGDWNGTRVATPVPVPVFTITPASLEFGSVSVGQLKELTLAVRNTGTAALTVTPAAIANARFVLASPAGAFTVAAGAAQTLTVRFVPVAAGSETASLVLNSNDPAAASTAIALTGTGTVPAQPGNFGGQWSTDYGSMTLTQNGANVTGVYPSYTGTLTGTVAGNVLTGTWVQPGTTGTLSFLLSADGNRFTGSWTRTTGGSGGGPWNGTRVTTPSVVAVIEVSPASLDFGSVAVGQTKALPVVIRNTGGAALQGSLAFSSALFTGAASVSVVAGGQQEVMVTFRPDAAAARTGTLTITSNAAVQPSVSVALSGTGTSAPAGVTELRVDDGTYERKVGAPGGDVFFMNRLTPARYPATLKAIRIYWHDEDGGLAPGTGISLLWAANAGGTANINPPAIQLRSAPGTVGQGGRFVEYAVAPMTISAGDFVVGFAVNNPAGILPMANDTSTPFAGRSYLSLEGTDFLLMNTIQGLTPGNLMIRAVVE